MAGTDSDVVAELRAQTRWLRLLGLQALRPLLTQVLATGKQKIVYELSDGKRTSRQIAQEAGVGAGSVSRLWAGWIAVGICTESREHPGRAEHLASLTSIGIDVTLPATVPQANGEEALPL